MTRQPGTWIAFPPDVTPYVHWSNEQEGDNPGDFSGEPRFRLGGVPFVFGPENFELFGQAGDPALAPKALPASDNGLRDAVLLNDAYASGKAVMMPPEMKNPHPWTTWSSTAFEARLPVVPADAIIVGVIDTGVPLCHRRTRLCSGETRIVSAWQQSATWAAKRPVQPTAQRHLPFGAEITGPEIDRLIAMHTTPGGLDEEAFNRDAGLVEREATFGQRDLDFRTAHGAHVLDLAAGMDPDAEPDELLRRLRIIVVNLPTQRLHGTAGAFLEYYGAMALARIVDVANALWRRSGGGASGAKGFPIAVNFSYGMQAGPMDGAQVFERIAQKMIRSRPDGAPLRIQMPAGNSNLERGRAELTSGPQADAEIGLRVQPGDQTSNYVEFWSEALPTGDAPGPDAFEVALTPPGAPTIRTGPAQPDSFFEFVDGARLYCRRRDFTDNGRTWSRVQFLLALRATDATAQALAPVPAGLWRIGVRCARPVTIDLRVQSDQPRLIQSRTALRSYFDDPAYRRFEPGGRVKDSFTYAPLDDAPAYAEAGEGPVWRAGTTNALASTPYVTAIGGYRVTDGRPAAISSTGRLTKDHEGEFRRCDAAYPLDDGVAHAGVLAAGSRDGSAVLFRGASMSCGLATRHLALHLVRWVDEGRPATGLSGRDWFHLTAEKSENFRPQEYGTAAAAKIGAGRIPYPTSYRRGRPRRIDR